MVMAQETDLPQGPVRSPAHAGTFYPAAPSALRQEVEWLLRGAGWGREEGVGSPGLWPRALIAPHAGYMYSGAVAASAYAQLEVGRTQIKRVVLMGPAHFVSFPGLATSGATAFATPLGNVPVDRWGLEATLALPGVRMREAAHRPEHSLEVHLPFLQTVLADFAVVPLLVGEAEESFVGRVLEHLWGEDETCIVISSDLSHYLDYRAARVQDERTAQAIEGLRGEAVSGEDACGWEAIRGLLWVARRRGLRGARLDLRNSGDTAGPRDRVVGYGAFRFDPGH